MQLTFLWIGKTRNKHWSALEQDYVSRIEHFVKTRIQIVAESKRIERSEMRAFTSRQETERILKHVKPGAYTILLDERGTVLTSNAVATFFSRRQQEGQKELVFLVGGASGVAPMVAERANFTLSLSALTFPHEMARTILLEQIYRAFAILHNLPYPR